MARQELRRDPQYHGRPAAADNARLIDLIERLHELILTKADPVLITSTIDETVSFARREFAEEDSELFRAHPFGWQAHLHEHQALLARLQTLRDTVEAESGGLDPGDAGELYDVLSDWLIHALWDTPLLVKRH